MTYTPLYTKMLWVRAASFFALLHLARVYMISRYSIQSISRASVRKGCVSAAWNPLIHLDARLGRGLDAKAQCHGGFHKQSCHQVIHFHFPHCQFHQISNVLSRKKMPKMSVLLAKVQSQHQSCKHLLRDQRIRDGKPKNIPVQKKQFLHVLFQHPTTQVASGKHLHNYGKSPLFMGKLTINGHFQ